MSHSAAKTAKMKALRIRSAARRDVIQRIEGEQSHTIDGVEQNKTLINLKQQLKSIK